MTDTAMDLASLSGRIMALETCVSVRTLGTYERVVQKLVLSKRHHDHNVHDHEHVDGDVL